MCGQEVWWTPLTKAKFENRTQCLLNQYGDDNKILAKSSLLENIPDHGAMKLTFKAYGKF